MTKQVGVKPTKKVIHLNQNQSGYTSKGEVDTEHLESIQISEKAEIFSSYFINQSDDTKRPVGQTMQTKKNNLAEMTKIVVSQTENQLNQA